MKKLFLMAVATATLFASCSKTEGPANDGVDGRVVIKLEGLNAPATRTIDAPGTAVAGEIDLTNGWVFVYNSDGTIAHNEMLNLTEAQDADGQLLENTDATPFEASADMKVYVIGNLKTDAADTDPGSVEAAELAALTSTNMLAAYEAISALQLTSSNEEIPLANSTGVPAALAPYDRDGNAETVDYVVNVTLLPLLSRVELVGVQAKDEDDGKGLITAFTIGGVYIDSYYPNYTYGGSGAVTTFEQGQSTDFTGNIMGDVTTPATTGWPAANSPLLSKPAAGTDVWAYNVPSLGVARLIVYLKSVTYTPTGGGTPETDVDQYITVGKYLSDEDLNGDSAIDALDVIKNMVRGDIYRIGVANDNEFEFGPKDLDPVPNPEDGTLTVKVTVDKWTVKTPDAVLM